MIWRCRLDSDTTIVIDHAERADPGCREIHQRRRAEATGADHQDRGFLQRELTRDRRPRAARYDGRNVRVRSALSIFEIYLTYTYRLLTIATALPRGEERVFARLEPWPHVAHPLRRRSRRLLGDEAFPRSPLRFLEPWRGCYRTKQMCLIARASMAHGICHEIDADSNIDFDDTCCCDPVFGVFSTDARAHQYGHQTQAGRDNADPARHAGPRPIPPMRWRKATAWRCNRIWLGSANITARSRAKSATAWWPRSKNSRKRAAAGRPARSIRRSAACWPKPRSGRRTMSAGRSSPTLAAAFGSGFPGKLVPQQTSDANGTKWSSPTGTIQVLLSRRKEANPTTAKLADREKKKPAGRSVDYTVVKPDFFVLSGLQGLKKFYVRGTFRGDEVRILTILYDQATENTVEPVVIAMSSAFNPFPSGLQIAGPAPRKTVEYGTGIVVSEDGAIVTDRQITDGCLSITIAGYGNADRIAEDKNHDLALLRIYGARGLKPLNIDGGAAKSALDVTGITDPQNQAGGAAVSSVKATALPSGGNGDLALSPAPG